MQMSVILTEVTEKNKLNVDKVASDIRSDLNTCKLTKYAPGPCGKFYSEFFTQSLEDIHPDVSEWGTIYTTLLSNDKFCEDLAAFMISYKPNIYEGLFVPLWTAIQSEASRKKPATAKIHFLQLAKAMLSMIQMRMSGITAMIKSQINDVNTLKFASTVDQVLIKLGFDLQALINVELGAAINPDDTTYQRNASNPPLCESMSSLIETITNCEAWYNDQMKSYELDESLVGDAAMKVKEAKLAQKKAERQFDELVMTKIRNIREERRNQKHAEMVGESIRAMREIKRVLRTAPIALLSPIAAAIVYIVSILYDKSTDIQDRKVLTDQLKDELEIVDEKIQMAERNGDEKARIELIRFKQKLTHEYERIMNVRYDTISKKFTRRPIL